MRSKYKPAALDLVKTNTEKNVKATTQRAFKRMPKLEMAIQALTSKSVVYVLFAKVFSLSEQLIHRPHM